MAKPTLLTLDEAAERLTIAKKTLRDWLKAKPPKLPGVKIGREWRIVESDLEAFLTQAIGPRPTDTRAPVTPPPPPPAPIDHEPEGEDLKPDRGPLRLVSKGQVPAETRPPAPVFQDPAQRRAALLARLRALQAEGHSTQAIANQLNAEGVSTLSGHGTWKKGTIANLLAEEM